MMVKIKGQPRLHPQFGFSLTIQNIQPSGEGSIKKAFDLLKSVLTKEGLFDVKRKRSLAYPPHKIALVTSIESAAYADFMKILNSRWPFVVVEIFDIQVQGEAAPDQIVAAIKTINAEADLVDVMVVTRGGGSLDDLAAFNDERVVRTIATSRIPTLVAIGHEIDESLSELAADKRASTPSHAAELLVPDKLTELNYVNQLNLRFSQHIQNIILFESRHIDNLHQLLTDRLNSIYAMANQDLMNTKQLLEAYNPALIIRRGFALVRTSRGLLQSVDDVKLNENINIQLKDGYLEAEVMAIHAKLESYDETAGRL
jgi:exodeoxyribonuclease VII large subunit